MRQITLTLIGLFFITAAMSQSMTVAEDNKVGIRNTAPESNLHIKHANGSPTLGLGNGLTIEHDDGEQWTIYAANGSNELRFYRGALNEVSFGADGSINTISDERRKENIALLKPGQLEKILALKPHTYSYKNDENNNIVAGFLAQELYKVIPSVVKHIPSDDDGNESWMVSYQSLIPFITKAMQEQQDIIENQKETIALLKQQQEEMLQRLANLENKL